MKIGNMNHPSKPIIEEIERIAKQGFEVAEITYELPGVKNVNPDEIKDIIANYNLEVIGHTDPNLPAIHHVNSIRVATLEYLKESADFFKRIGVKKMNIHPFYPKGHARTIESFTANLELLRTLNQYCQALGLELMLENYFAPFDTPDQFKKIIAEVPGLKIHLDIGHLNLGFDLAHQLEKFFMYFGENIVHLHLHDNHSLTDEHLPLGCGDVKWEKIIQIIKASGYNNFITLEVFCSDCDYLLMSKDKLRQLWDKG